MSFEKWLQSRLTAHGFAVGPIDGKVGPLTKRAISAFQARHGLEQTNVADEMTVQALRASATAMTPKEMAATPDRLNIFDGLPGSASKWPVQKDVRTFFGGVGERQRIIQLPYAMYLAWDKNALVRRMSCHELVADSVIRVLEEVASIYTEGERARIGLDLFGGCLNVRRMRGGSAYSMHSWGIALDFDPERNQLRWTREKARLAQDDAVPFWQAWEAEGWVSLGRARNFDWMHVQAARL